MMATAMASERAAIRRAVVRMRARIMATVFAMVGGAGVFAATAWLLVRGGDHVGEHLALLRHFFPGYAVTWPGAFVGLFWGALGGGAIGWAVAWVYNQIVERRAD
jgi:hypothetical protein